jgi:hypothetical protein
MTQKKVCVLRSLNLFYMPFSRTEDDRGVSRALSSITDLNERLVMLLVHGMLHLQW